MCLKNQWRGTCLCVFLKKVAMSLQLKNVVCCLAVFRSLASNENMSALEKSCDKITMPSQVIWGANDNVRCTLIGWIQRSLVLYSLIA